MLRMFDFKCPECCRIEEHLIQDEEDVPCSDCGVTMKRMVAAPRLDYKGFWLAGMESGDRWTKTRSEHQKRQERAKENHDSYSIGGQRNQWDNTPEVKSNNGERLKKVQ